MERMPGFSIPLADGNLAQLFLVAAMLVVIITLLTRIYRYQARQKRSSCPRGSDRKTEDDSRGLRTGAPPEIVRWEIEMQELARDLRAEIDSKMVALGHLIRDADRAAARLERLEAAIDRAGGTAPTVRSSSKDQQATTSVSRESSDAEQEILRLADYGFSPADIASRIRMPVGQVELILRIGQEKR